MADIPVGYQLHIHSWENDGDAPSTEILNGLSKEDVAFYVDLLRHWGTGGSFGNAYDGDADFEEVAKVIEKTVAAHPKVSPEVAKKFDLSRIDRDDAYALEDTCCEIMCELLGGSEHYDFRVFDGYVVYHFESPVKDVTSKFKAKKKSRRKK